MKIKEGTHETHLKQLELRLPDALPSRLNTLQLACRDTVCRRPIRVPSESVSGSARAGAKRLKRRLACPADDRHSHLTGQPTETLDGSGKWAHAATGCAITREGRDQLRGVTDN